MCEIKLRHVKALQFRLEDGQTQMREGNLGAMC
jgi:hypothetical protein